MSIITREDGVVFVMQAYREVLTSQKSSAMVQEVRQLAEQQGDYLQLFQKPVGNLEVVCSREPGYLLGESVWNFFDKSDNLIFCEMQEDSNQILLVVIRDGSVYFDGKVATSQLKNELLPMMSQSSADDNKFQVYVSGDVPLSEKSGASKFTLPAERVEKFTSFDDSILDQLTTISELQLMPLVLALRSRHLAGNKRLVLTIVLIVIVAMAAWLIFKPNPKAQAYNAQLARAQDPYLVYEAAMTTPNPKAQLANLNKAINKAYVVPGWTASSIIYKGDNVQIQVSPNTGSLMGLENWAKHNNLKFSFDNNGATLDMPVQLAARAKPATIYQSKQVLELLTDHLDRLLHARTVTMGIAKLHGPAIETPITINLTEVSPEVIAIIGEELSGLPVAMQSANVTLQNGLLSGTINLSVWGT